MEQYLPIREQFAQDAGPSRNKRSSDNNSYGAFILGNDEYSKVGKWVCHGWLSDFNIRDALPNRTKIKTHGIKYMLSAVMKPHTSAQNVRLFIDWLVNRSPYASMHLDKDVDSILKYGYFVRADMPVNVITSGMIASRFVTESYTGGETFEKRCAIWRELYDMGIGENEAFFFAHMFSPVSVKQIYPVEFSRLSAGHSTFYATNYQENYVRNFLNGTPANPSSKLLSQGRGYENDTINSLWAKTTDSDAFGNAVKSLVPRSKVVKTDHHIFRKAPVNGWSYKGRDDFMSIIEQLKEMLNA
jgi:hypothetical protein